MGILLIGISKIARKLHRNALKILSMKVVLYLLIIIRLQAIFIREMLREISIFGIDLFIYFWVKYPYIIGITFIISNIKLIIFDFTFFFKNKIGLKMIK